MSEKIRPPSGRTFYDLGDFTVDKVGRGEYRLHAKETAFGDEVELSPEEAQRALRKWGILHGITSLPLGDAERYIQRIRLAKAYELEGKEGFADAYYELANQDADRAGMQIDPLPPARRLPLK